MKAKNTKKILHINLEKEEYELKAYPDLENLIGGVGLGLKLLLEHKEENPLILSCGPLSGLFPYTSKTSLVAFNDKSKIIEAYAGGGFAAKLNLLRIDSIKLTGLPKQDTVVTISASSVDFSHTKEIMKESGITGSKSEIHFGKNVLVDNYFSFGNVGIKYKNLSKIVILGEGEVKIPNPKEYWELYKQILEREKELDVKYSSNPSCWGCPAGCERSKEGEGVGRAAILPKCLIACQFAENIYKDIPLVFACLTVLGFKYNHEDLENLPSIVGGIRKELVNLPYVSGSG